MWTTSVGIFCRNIAAVSGIHSVFWVRMRWSHFKPSNLKRKYFPFNVLRRLLLPELRRATHHLESDLWLWFANGTITVSLPAPRALFQPAWPWQALQMREKIEHVRNYCLWIPDVLGGRSVMWLTATKVLCPLVFNVKRFNLNVYA